MGMPQPPPGNPNIEFHNMIIEKQMCLAAGTQPQDDQNMKANKKCWKQALTPEELKNWKEMKAKMTPEERALFKSQKSQ